MKGLAFPMVCRYLLATVLAIGGCTDAAKPSSLWTASLGYNATLSASGSPTYPSWGNTLMSSDGTTIFVAESYLTYSGAPSATPRVFAFDSSTGVQRWPYTPTQFQVPTNSLGGIPGTILLSTDSSTIFVVMPSTISSTFVFALQANTGAVVWGPISFPGDSQQVYPFFNVSLPALSASGDLCLFTNNNAMVSCLMAATGVTRFSIQIESSQNTPIFGMDSLRKYIMIGYTNDGSSTYFKVYGTPTGAFLWNYSLPPGYTAYSTVQASDTTLFVIGSNKILNTASLFELSLEYGTLLTGFPAVLPSAQYVSTTSLTLTPTNQLLLGRSTGSADLGSYSIALLSATTGVELWTWTMPGYPGFAKSTPSADGTSVFTGSACAIPGSGEKSVCANGASASLYTVSISSGTLLSSILPLLGASSIFPLAPDVVSGGVVLIGYQFYPDGQESVSTFGVSAQGSVLWDTGVSGPAPAPEPFFVGLHASSRTLYMLEKSRSNDATAYLRALSLPALSTPSSSLNVGAIVGGVLGGIAFITVSYFAFSNRAAILELCGGKAATESQPLVPNNMLSQRQVSMPVMQAWGQAPRATAPPATSSYLPPEVESGDDTTQKPLPSFKKAYRVT